MHSVFWRSSIQQLFGFSHFFRFSKKNIFSRLHKITRRLVKISLKSDYWKPKIALLYGNMKMTSRFIKWNLAKSSRSLTLWLCLFVSLFVWKSWNIKHLFIALKFCRELGIGILIDISKKKLTVSFGHYWPKNTSILPPYCWIHIEYTRSMNIYRNFCTV